MLESHKVFWNKHGRIKPVKWQYKIKNINKIKHHSTSNLSKKVLVLPKENWNSVEKGKKKSKRLWGKRESSTVSRPGTKHQMMVKCWWVDRRLALNVTGNRCISHMRPTWRKRKDACVHTHTNTQRGQDPDNAWNTFQFYHLWSGLFLLNPMPEL